jgi:hypothetical protein
MSVSLVLNQNVYISLADAKTYFTNNKLYYDAWTTATDDQKSIALIMATSKIDRQRLKGERAVYTQTLQFPRAFFVGDIYNRQTGLTIDNVRGEGWYLETSVSNEVKYATCEEALKILTVGANANKRIELQQQGVKRFKLGNLEEEYSLGMIAEEKLLSAEARQMLARYLMGVASIC